MAAGCVRRSALVGPVKGTACRAVCPCVSGACGAADRTAGVNDRDRREEGRKRRTGGGGLCSRRVYDLRCTGRSPGPGVRRAAGIEGRLSQLAGLGAGGGNHGQDGVFP